MQILFGFTLALALSWGAWKMRLLTRRGMWAATSLGGLIFSSGHLPWSAPIIGFFLSSSLLSLVHMDTDAENIPAGDKRRTRDWRQVLANGGIGAVLATIALLRPDWEWPVIAYSGAMAAVNADTWATELGALSTLKPRLITSWKAVEPGTSGGITPLGTLSSLAGSAFMALVSMLVFPNLPSGRLILTVTIAGQLGSFLDSVLGASLQAKYFCPHCEKETEQHPQHSCQRPTVYKRGWGWLDNDGVNFLSSAAGSVICVSLWPLFPS